eukprot:363578-Chlamydomonas_euryale.AAC.4
MLRLHNFVQGIAPWKRTRRTVAILRLVHELVMRSTAAEECHPQLSNATPDGAAVRMKVGGGLGCELCQRIGAGCYKCNQAAPPGADL